MSPAITCPKCFRLVSLPDNGDVAAWVRCPLCREEYTLELALNSSPPALEVIRRPAPSAPPETSFGKSDYPARGAAGKQASGQHVPELLAPTGDEFSATPAVGFLPATDDFTLQPAEEIVANAPVRRPAATVGAGADEPWLTATPGKAVPGDRTTGGRRRKRRSNPVMFFVQIVVGGIVGLALAVAILFWGFKVDLLNLAKSLPPFLVPEELRSKESSATQASARAIRTPSTNSRDISSDSEVAEQRVASAANATSTRRALPPLPDAPPAVPAEPEGPKSETFFSLSDFTQALGAARDASDALQKAPVEQVQANSAEFKILRRDYYIQLAKLAETVTLLRCQPDESLSARAVAAQLLLDIADDPTRLHDLGSLAGAWMNSSGRITSGIVLAGTVQEIASTGQLFRTTVKLFGRDTVVPIISAEKMDVAIDAPVLVVGTIVKSPAENLIRYSGEDDTVVWAAIVIPEMDR